ncbi:HCMVUL63, partial [Human betaherpesvirus 5]|uniref:Uncharacterized protein UL63 n=1 Tax=Human cytomegalovirus (strain AD169) TaxID=10360 RepID=UL63_HCMVA
ISHQYHERPIALYTNLVILGQPPEKPTRDRAGAARTSRPIPPPVGDLHLFGKKLISLYVTYIYYTLCTPNCRCCIRRKNSPYLYRLNFCLIDTCLELCPPTFSLCITKICVSQKILRCLKTGETCVWVL